MPIDAETIKRKIVFIERDLRKLKKISLLSFSEYMKNDDFEDLAERYLERMIGRMIDINYHILSSENGLIPEDYYKSFIYMGREKYLPIDLAESMASSAGLRNRLAHEYDDIDMKRVYGAIHSSIKEVPEYLEQIDNFLEKFSAQKRML